MKMTIKNKLILPAALATGILLSGCGMIKPYNKPVFVDIEPNQTAFVIPLEGKTSDQGQFQSLEFLEDNQVAAKRIQIPRTWYKTGKLRGKGEYKDDVRVIVVDRFPATREWLNDTSRGTSDKAEGFVGESKDSIKFLVGISATASIEEPDTAQFLYKYSGKTLSEVMDFEIRNKIGTTLLEKYGSMSMEEIRSNKEEVIEHVRKIVIPHFKDESGISLGNIGYVGDLEYIDPKVQAAINERFNAQEQQKAQTIKNQTEIDKALAEKQSIENRASTLSQTIKLRELEIREEWIKKWDGKLPSVQTGEGGGNLLLNVDKISNKE
jgi:hypothetical protein